MEGTPGWPSTVMTPTMPCDEAERGIDFVQLPIFPLPPFSTSRGRKAAALHAVMRAGIRHRTFLPFFASASAFACACARACACASRRPGTSICLSRIFFAPLLLIRAHTPPSLHLSFALSFPLPPALSFVLALAFAAPPPLPTRSCCSHSETPSEMHVGIPPFSSAYGQRPYDARVPLTLLRSFSSVCD